MQQDLREAHAEGRNPDASDLALLALLREPEYRSEVHPAVYHDKLRELREVGASALVAAGYCPCGEPLTEGRCKSCSYDHRFRDPAFIKVWQRWQNARAAWDKAWRDLPFKCFTPEHDVYDPDPARIAEPAAAVAREFIESRAAYKAKLAEFA